jgi:hydrogenase-1 operon protein HyaF
MGIEQIPVTVVSPDAGLSGNARPLLREIVEMMGALASAGTPGILDLAALPLTPADKVWLRERLGTGQVQATLDAEGISSVEETACPGVWWVTHRDSRERVLSEFIEVTLVPEILKAYPEDVQMGQAYLENVISALS